MAWASRRFLSERLLSRRITAPATCCLAAVLAAATAAADTPLSRDFMGSGMHAYHAGDYLQSVDELTAAIEAGCQDPRAYYFRALALLQQGRDDEAVADMQEGALLESGGPGGIVVGRSLERVQGRHRLMLERYRRRALIEQQARDQRRIEQRYTDMIESEPERLRQRRPEAFVPPAQTGSAAPTPAPQTPPPTTPPTTPPATTNDDPFATPADEPMNDGGDDPFATPGDDDPFGGSSPAPAAGDDPFGGNGADPFGAGAGSDAGANDDPFGSPPATPAVPPAGSEPSDDPLFDDPFGDASSGINRPRGNGTLGDQTDQQVESIAAETDDVFDQRDEQQEMESAEVDDTLDQRDQQAERDAAAGEGGALVEPIFE